MIHSSGTRMVPSLREDVTNEDNVYVEIDICGDSNAKDLSERFLSCYETICKHADACVYDGMQVLAKHFDHCQRRFLHFIHNSNVSIMMMQCRCLPSQATHTTILNSHTKEFVQKKYPMR